MKKKLALCLLLDKENRIYYLFACNPLNLDDNYIKHFSGRRKDTASWMKKMKENQKRPCLFVVEVKEINPIETFVYFEAIIKAMNYYGYYYVNKKEQEEFLNLNSVDERLFNYYKEKIGDGKLFNCNNCMKKRYMWKTCNQEEIWKPLAK